MQVKKQKFNSCQEALKFAGEKLSEGYGNIRMITAESKQASKYDVTGEQVQVRYWRR